MRFFAFVLPAFLLCFLFACKKPVGNADVSVWREDNHPTISTVSLFDTLHENSWRSMDIREISGTRVIYENGKQTLYFEYDADAGKLLTLLNCLPFRKSNHISDTTCRLQPFDFSLSGKDIISEEEITASGFFWNIRPADFIYYECLKNPARHTVLIHRKTGKILHRIET